MAPVATTPLSTERNRPNTAGSAAGRSVTVRRIIGWTKGIAGIGAAGALWEMIRGSGIVDRRDLPSLQAIGAAWWIDFQTILQSTAETMVAWLLGLGLAAVIGMMAGIWLASAPRADHLLRPFIEFVRPIPSVALIPIALMILGVTASMKLSLIAFAALWPVLFNTYAGTKAVDQRLVEIGIIAGLSKGRQLSQIVVPFSLPGAATGIRTASSIALVLAITVEMLTGVAGIGGYLNTARINAQAAPAWAATIWTGVLGYFASGALRALERRVLHWSAENRNVG